MTIYIITLIRLLAKLILLDSFIINDSLYFNKLLECRSYIMIRTSTTDMNSKSSGKNQIYKNRIDPSKTKVVPTDDST